MSIERIKDYVENWNSQESPKESNNKIFIADFTSWIKTLDKDHWSFSGENYYCGFTATVNEYPLSIPVCGIGFEFAYRRADFVKVFTDNHNGYYVPEYIDVQSHDAVELLEVIKSKFNEWGGFRKV